MRALLDLILPLECGGCGVPGTGWCAGCEAVLDVEPVALAPRVVDAPAAWATGEYGGPRRHAVIAAKERGRRDLAGPLGAALAGAVVHLRRWGELDPPELAPLVLVPAPSRAVAARRRGGDPVVRMAQACAQVLGGTNRHERVTVWCGLSSARGVRDSVGLRAEERTANLHGRVRVAAPVPAPGASVLLVDDVLTTGATAAASTAALAGAGVRVRAVLVVAGVR